MKPIILLVAIAIGVSAGPCDYWDDNFGTLKGTCKDKAHCTSEFGLWVNDRCPNGKSKA
jgi:hypothetical protein